MKNNTSGLAVHTPTAKLCLSVSIPLHLPCHGIPALLAWLHSTWLSFLQAEPDWTEKKTRGQKVIKIRATCGTTPPFRHKGVERFFKCFGKKKKEESLLFTEGYQNIS